MGKDKSFILHDKSTSTPVKFLKHQPNEVIKSNLFTNLIETYFHITYLICFGPFKFVYSYPKGKFDLRQNTFQKGVCIVLSILGFCSKIKKQLWLLDDSRQNNSESEYEDPRSYLSLLSYFFGWIYRIKTLYLLWFRQNDFLEIVNEVTCFVKMGNLGHEAPLWMRRILSKTFLRIVFLVWFVITLGSRISSVESTILQLTQQSNNETVFILTFRVLLSIGTAYQ